MKIQRKIKQKTALRLMVVAGIAGVLLLSGVVTMVVIQLGDSSMTKAAEGGMEAGLGIIDLNSGEILSKFDWDEESPLSAVIGPNALSAGKTARCSAGGRSSSMGINAGSSGEGINLTLKGTTFFDVDG